MKGGIRLEGKKDASINPVNIKRPTKLPSRIFIPLAQSASAPPVPCVRSGDFVRAGQVIAKAKAPEAVDLHASASGEVAGISDHSHPLEGASLAVEIIPDGRNLVMDEIGQVRRHWESLEPGDLAVIFRKNGLVGLEGGMFPLHVKLAQASGGSIETLVLNGCESEPYLTSDYALMMAHPLEILKGGEILRHAFKAERVVIAVEDNKTDAAELLKSKIYFLKWHHWDVKILPSRFPQEAPSLLAADICRKDFNQSLNRILGLEGQGCFEDPHQKAVIALGVVVQSVATAFSVYEAVVFQKPLYERVVTVGGECVIEPKNWWLPLGICFRDAIKLSKGLMREPLKMLMNGPMAGEAQTRADVPVIKGTRAILALGKELAAPAASGPCIHCTRCVEVCPAGVIPVMAALAAEQGLFEIAKSWGSEYCIHCGACAYVCPVSRPMTGLLDPPLEKINKASPRKIGAGEAAEKPGERFAAHS